MGQLNNLWILYILQHFTKTHTDIPYKVLMDQKCGQQQISFHLYPIRRRMHGRPTIRRKKDASERSNKHIVSKVGKKVLCGICKEAGHNKNWPHPPIPLLQIGLTKRCHARIRRLTHHLFSNLSGWMLDSLLRKVFVPVNQSQKDHKEF